ncbi:MAG: hypothetical protein MH137_11240 [Flavobacteriales bacterium]|nr:hypothetical protein [Flavobacteriales bacterium]
MQTLVFSNNWNQKLNCDAYTTIRLRNDGKYSIGGYFEVVKNNSRLHEAKIIDIKHFYLSDLNEFMARVDTGLSANDCKEMIMKMYSKYNIDWQRKQLSFILLLKVK